MSPVDRVSPKHAAAVPADEPAPVVGVRVVSGSPSPEELAAVIAVLQAQSEQSAAQGRAQVESSPRARWDASARGMRRPLWSDAGTWSRSLR